MQIFYRTEAELAEAGMPWMESLRGDWPGISAFLQVNGVVYHTYSTFGRGIEESHNSYPYLDLTALGRQEAWEEPKGRTTPLGLHVGRPACASPTNTTRPRSCGRRPPVTDRGKGYEKPGKLPAGPGPHLHRDRAARYHHRSERDDLRREPALHRAASGGPLVPRPVLPAIAGLRAAEIMNRSFRELARHFPR